MKITEVKVFHLYPGADESGNRRGKYWNFVFVKVYTDAGIDGVGEAFASGKAKTTEAAVRRVRAVARRQGPDQGPAQLAGLLSRVALSAWDRDEGGPERRRDRAVGHLGQGLRPAGVQDAGRSGARPDPSLRKHAPRPRLLGARGDGQERVHGRQVRPPTGWLRGDDSQGRCWPSPSSVSRERERLPGPTWTYCSTTTDAASAQRRPSSSRTPSRTIPRSSSRSRP